MSKLSMIPVLSLVAMMALADSVAEADVEAVAAPVLKTTSSAYVVHSDKRSFRKGLVLGICVDQALTAEGISLKLPVAGQAYSVDDATKSAIAAAVTQCRSTLGISTASNSGVSGAATVVAPTAASTSNTSL